MTKRTLAICRQKPRNGLNVFDHFVGFVLKGFKTWEEHYFCVQLSVSPCRKDFLRFFFQDIYLKSKYCLINQLSASVAFI